MINDPIVEEVYQSRQKILQKWGGDLNKWLDHLRDANRQHADRVVTLEMVRQKSSSRPAGEELVAFGTAKDS